MRRYFVLLITIQLMRTASAAPLIGNWVVNPENGHEYALLDSRSWVDSEVAAIRLGGHLATVRNQAEQDFVYQTFADLAGPRLLWIGLNDNLVEGTFQWTSGEPVSYTHWAPGEPNNSFGYENFVAMFYPGHTEEGLWNDWGERTTDPIGIPFSGVVEVDPANRVVPTFSLDAGSDWLAITPEGDHTGEPIGSVGLAYESAHAGWNTDVNFDTSQWSQAQVVGDEQIWGDGTAGPTYFRDVFTLNQPLADVVMLASVDDDALIYINGQLVVSDANGQANGFGPLDVTSYLHVGENLIAIKAQNAGGPASLGFHLFAVPEPPSVLLAALGFLVPLRLCNRKARHKASGQRSWR